MTLSTGPSVTCPSVSALSTLHADVASQSTALEDIAFVKDKQERVLMLYSTFYIYAVRGSSLLLMQRYILDMFAMMRGCDDMRRM